MEAVGRALVGLSAYLQLKKAAMHEYHLWNLKKNQTQRFSEHQTCEFFHPLYKYTHSHISVWEIENLARLIKSC